MPAYYYGKYCSTNVSVNQRHLKRDTPPLCNLNIDAQQMCSNYNAVDVSSVMVKCVKRIHVFLAENPEAVIISDSLDYSGKRSGI